MNSTNPNETIGLNGRPVMRGLFVTRLIALDIFRQIREGFTKVPIGDWTNIDNTTGKLSIPLTTKDYGAKIAENSTATNDDEREAVIMAKENLIKILKLENLYSHYFYDAFCDDIHGPGVCPGQDVSCGCHDGDSKKDCCCPPPMQIFRNNELLIFWTPDFSLSAYVGETKLDGIDKKLSTSNNVSWYEIPKNVTKVKIRLSWLDYLNPYEIVIDSNLLIEESLT